MTIGGDRLGAMLGTDPDPDLVGQVPKPQPDQVGYVRPNLAGARKMCGNCYKFIEGGLCLEVAGKIQPGQVCNYHVPGQPFPAGTVPPAGLARRMSPRIAGLMQTPNDEGTSCNNCRWYGATTGMGDNPMEEVGACGRVDDPPGVPATVEALGCCDAWEGAQDV